MNADPEMPAKTPEEIRRGIDVHDLYMGNESKIIWTFKKICGDLIRPGYGIYV